MRQVTTFPSREECERARRLVGSGGLSQEVISPEPGFRLVGAPALVLEAEARAELAGAQRAQLVCSGWVDYRPASIRVPDTEPPEFEEDVFGHAVIMVLAPCVADETKIRIVAHISGDLMEAFPYLNAEMKQASYNVHGPTFTFMDGYRMVSAYPRRIAVAKADELVDAWRVLEDIRQRVNETWARRHEIEPSYERRNGPPALEIYKRLPRTNCGQCGELTCLAFAVKVHGGAADVRRCQPVFDGEFTHLKDALLEICAGLGVDF